MVTACALLKTVPRLQSPLKELRRRDSQRLLHRFVSRNQMHKVADFRGRDARQLFTVIGSGGRRVLHYIGIGEDTATRHRPARGEHRDHATVETIMEP